MAGKCYISDGWLYGPINITHHPSPNRSGGMAVPSGVNGVVMHTMVGDLPGADGWFLNPSSEVSAHFGISQTGQVIQWVPVNGGVAWAECSGNGNWYSIEHADHANPHNPITEAQMTASAQVVECLSRYGNFPLQEANSPSQEGFGVHYMGGEAWGGHSCPDYPVPGTPFARSKQRPAILAIAKAIRGGGPTPPAPPQPGPPLPTSLLLVEGSSGEPVRYLQLLLNAHKVSAQLVVDGQFGPATEAAVKAFQAHALLTVDGEVGPKTWAALSVPHEIDPGVEILPGFFRHYGDGHTTANAYAARRSNTWTAIVAHSHSHGTPENAAALAKLDAFTALPESGTKAIPTNVVFYTLNP